MGETSLSLPSDSGGGNNDGGNIEITSGNGSGTHDGGGIDILSGSGGSSNGTSGYINLETSQANAEGDTGEIFITTGDGGFTTGGNAGNIEITTGNGRSGVSDGGSLFIALGAGFGGGANGRLNISNLPTSSAGLSSGDIWNNGGVLTIV